MRYFEIQGGLRMVVSLEEEAIMAMANSPLADEDLGERDQEVARKMVSRGILNRLSQDDKIYYTLNGLEEVWRI